MWELNHNELWVPKSWCFRIVVLEKTLESPLDGKQNKPVNPKGNQPWIFMEGLMLKLKHQYLGHLIWTADSLEKTLMLGKIEGKKEKRVAEDDMVRYHHQLNEDEFEQTPEESEGQGSLAWCIPWDLKELDTT